MGQAIPIVLVDDDADDRYLTEKAFQASSLANPIATLTSGDELLAYLRHEDGYSAHNAPRPGLILLDYHMPGKTGLDTLHEIRADDALSGIPVIILTTSSAERDVVASYENGANSFVTKPVTFEGLVQAIQDIDHYWMQVVKLP